MGEAAAVVEDDDGEGVWRGRAVKTRQGRGGVRGVGRYGAVDAREEVARTVDEDVKGDDAVDWGGIGGDLAVEEFG